MISDEELEKLIIMTGEQDEKLLSLLFEDAEEFVLGYTNRTEIIKPLKKPVRDLALIAYNRMGTEGETGRSEAGETYSFDSAPKHIFDILKKYRLARCGGYAHEKKQDSETVSEK